MKKLTVIAAIIMSGLLMQTANANPLVSTNFQRGYSFDRRADYRGHQPEYRNHYYDDHRYRNAAYYDRYDRGYNYHEEPRFENRGYENRGYGRNVRVNTNYGQQRGDNHPQGGQRYNR